MANCKFCGKPVASCFVWHESCFVEAMEKCANDICDHYCKFREAYGKDEEELYLEHCTDCVIGELLALAVQI